MRKDSIGAELQTATPSIAEALNQTEALIESSRYKEAREKLKEVSQNFHFPIISEESYRLHYLRSLLFSHLGEYPAAGEEVEEALRIFKTLNGSNGMPIGENLPDFVKENLRKLRDVEISLLAGLRKPDSNEKIERKGVLIQRISEISNSLENLSPLAKMHYHAGCIKLNMAKLDKAMEHFEHAATSSFLSKDWAVLSRAVNGISRVYFHKGNLGLAIQTTERAIAYSRKAGNRQWEAKLRVQLANWQLGLGIWRPAIVSLPKILEEIKKSNDTAYYCSALIMWGHANLLRGYLKESKRAFAEALRLATKYRLNRMSKLSHALFAFFYYETGQFAKAENHLKTLLETATGVIPSNSFETSCRHLLGDVYVAQNQLEKARKAYAACQSCLAIFPKKDDEACMYRGMGIIYAREGQFSAARRSFKKALELFEKCGIQWEKAKTFVVAAESGVFTRAEMEPDIAWAKEVFKRLEHPAWAKRAGALLKKAKNSGRAVPLPLLREQTEREQIVKALLECNGNITQAAKKVGLLRETLRYKIRRYQIEV